MKSLKLLSDIALSFKNLNNFNEEMERVLEKIGSAIDVSRIYIFFNKTEEIVDNTFEWCNEGIDSQIQNLQDIEYKSIPSWKVMFADKGHIFVDDIMDLPEDIVELLKAQDIKSIVAYPLIIENQTMGYIGFDECRYRREWKAEELEILNTVSGIIANAYERKFFQEDIMDSEANFNNFFETIDDIFIVAELNGKIIHCNKSLSNKLGYSLLELKDMNIIDLHPIDQREQAGIIVEKMFKGEANCCPLQVQGKQGQLFSVETRVWLGKWNKQDCIFSISKDITKEKEGLQLISKIFKKNPLPMSISTVEEEKIVKVNSAFLESTGYCEEDVIGKTVHEIGLLVEPDKFKGMEDKAIRQGEIKNEQMLIRCKDGSILIGLFSLEKISNKGEESLLTVMVDITERVKLANRVEENLQKLTNIIEGTNLGTWEWDIKTGELIVNEQWARMLGYGLKELQDINMESWNSFLHPQDAVRSNKLMKKHLDGESEYYDCEVRIQDKDGRWVWVHDRGKVIERDLSGIPLKMFGTHSDISKRKQIDEKLKENEKRFMLALDETKAGLWDYDMINKELFLSPMWKNILGYEDDEIENSVEAWQELWHPDDKESILLSIKDHLQRKSHNYEMTKRLRHKDGSWRWILTRGGILRDDKGVPYRWLGTNIDVTTEREQSLELDRFFSVNLDLLCIADMEGNFIKTNKAWEDILGYTTEELKERKFLEFVHIDDIDSTLEAMEQLKKCEKVSKFINRYINVDGEYRYIEWRSNPYEDVIYASARDITERIEYEQKILEISNRDALTNVYNRRYVFDRSKEIIEEYKRVGKIFSLSILDIDHFKKINDMYGHQIGDCVLKEFTKIIDKNLRPYDILGRYGGEEFILILNNSNKKDSHLVIERILDIIRNKSFNFNGENIEFTFSAGISSCEEIDKEKITIDSLVAIADERMYDAKENGRNQIVCD